MSGAERQVRVSLRRAASAVALCLLSCGGKSDSGEPSASTGGHSGTPPTDPSSCGGGSSGGIESLGEAFGSTTPEPTATYTPSTKPGPNETTGYCSTTELEGTLDGEPVYQRYDFGGSAANDGANWLYAASLPAWGLAELSGVADPALDWEQLEPGNELNASEGRLVLPKFLPRSERPLCTVGPNTLERGVNYLALQFGAVGRLPACEDGTLVSGSLDLCVGDTCDTLAGSLDGVVIDDEFRVQGASPGYVDGTTDTLSIRVLFTATSPTTAIPSEAWIRDRTRGAVYCAGVESCAYAEPESGAFGTRYKRIVHLRELRRVGDCDDVPAPDALLIRVCAP